MTDLSFKTRLKGLINRPDGAVSTSFLEDKGHHPYDLQRFCELCPTTPSDSAWARRLNQEGNELGTGWDRDRKLLRKIIEVCGHNAPSPSVIFHYVQAHRVRDSLIEALIEDLRSTDLDNIQPTAPGKTIETPPEPIAPPPEEPPAPKPTAPEPPTPELPPQPPPVRRPRRQPRPATPQPAIPGIERSSPKALAKLVMDRGQHHIEDDPDASAIMQQEADLLVELYHRPSSCQDASEERLRQILKFPDEQQNAIDYGNAHERAAWYTQAILDTQLKHLSRHKRRGGL